MFLLYLNSKFIKQNAIDFDKKSTLDSRGVPSAIPQENLENWMNFPFSTDNKMVLVVRTDLSMGKGKAAAQCAHAAVDLYKKASKDTPKLGKNFIE